MTLYPLVGLLAGFLAGLLGIGGGVVVVPLLVMALGWQQVDADLALRLAVGTSLATIAITSISSARAHYLHGNVRKDCVWLLLPGLIFGAIGGVFLGDALSGRVLSLLLGVFFLLLATKLLIGLRPGREHSLPGRKGMIFAGGSIGLASALFGIGGGTLTVPFLERCSVPMRQAVGTSAAAGIPIAVVGAITAMWVGNASETLSWATGYVYWPAFIGIVLLSVPGARAGALIASWLPDSLLKRVFAVLLIVVGLKFLMG
ncbi:sulfite exporter TauE/SafE family protein [Billgrantia pellis]|uniref:Probable membrane transporter protein n=1 Tax=Billgrantia pellis TaxID=2606936 RepID=A0A7V7G162_9GAMM|nr:sulfite exporter TauE/SafE family protein [Halomonas pellis]